jgi:hypothetical protein
MQRLGFSCVNQTRVNLRFQRGYQKGDFDASVAQIVIDISLPLATCVEIDVCYGWVALFDAGDLWRVSREVEEQLGRSEVAHDAPAGRVMRRAA